MNKLDTIIRESIEEVLSENVESNVLLTEMSRINSNESGNIFPYNAWEIQIWSDDHNPPHFHILKDGWNVKFSIESGEMIGIKTEGKKMEILNYMLKNVEIWLKSQCAILPMITNQQNAMAQWIQIHNGKR